MRYRSSYRRMSNRSAEVHQPPFAVSLLLAALLVVCLTLVIGFIGYQLLGRPGILRTRQLEVSDWLNVLKLLAALVGGALAVVGLVISYRRQRLAEASQLFIERDAAEQRVTELYSAAVEQLGSEKAPVRLAALYALDRLGQSNPAQRPAVLNVIAAYLRMPYEATTDPRDEERVVRITAQRVISEHLIEDTSEAPPLTAKPCG